MKTLIFHFLHDMSEANASYRNEVEMLHIVEWNGLPRRNVMKPGTMLQPSTHYGLRRAKSEKAVLWRRYAQLKKKRFFDGLCQKSAEKTHEWKDRIEKDRNYTYC